jgi:hypothetical protein
MTKELKISAAREGDTGYADKRDGRCFSCNDGEGNGPPRHRAITEEVIACGLLLPAEPRPEQNDTDQVTEDDDEIEQLH